MQIELTQEEVQPVKQRKGFAAIPKERQREIASAGGRAAHAKGTAHKWTPEEAREAGVKGGQAVSQDREFMSQIGRLGGLKVSRDKAHMSRIGKRGGEAPGKASDGI